MPMNHLAKLQHTFQDCVLQPDKPAATTWVSASGRAAPETQLSIYTHAYAARLTEVLANDYPATLMAIGDAQFDQLAADYIRAHPSCYYSLREFGRHLPKFISDLIEQNRDWQDMHWLHELALFEWCLGQAFDVEDATLLTEQAMASVPIEAWPELRFTLHPSVQRLDLEWNVPEMWRTLTADEPEQISASRGDASPWLIWREQFTTRFRSMQMDEQLALDKLRGGACFNEVCEVLATQMREDQVPLYAAGLLKGWITQGLISGKQMGAE